MGQPFYCLAADAGLWGERGYDDGSTPSTWLSIASKAAWLSSTGISHHSLLPHSPSIHLSTVNSSPGTGIAPQSLNPSSQPLHLSGDLCPSLGCVYDCGKDCLILIPVRLPQVRCFTLNLKCFSSDSDTCPAVGIGPLLQFPHPRSAGPAPLTLLFFALVPSSYWYLCGCICSFLLIGYSCPSQLVFCMHFCVWWCIPDVSVERDVLHVHLLLHHLVLPHSSILAWRNPWTEEPRRLQSMGSQRVGHDRATNTHLIIPALLWGLNEIMNGNYLVQTLIRPSIDVDNDTVSFQ